MGAVGSVLANMEPLHPDIAQHKPMFQRLGFSSWGANGMRKLFCAIDEDHSGEISIREFLKYFDLDRTKFSKRAFAIFDADSSGELDFKELTMSIWNYCTLTTMTLMTFAFDLYDTDSSGMIDGDEMLCVVNEVYGTSAAKNSVYAQKIIRMIKAKQAVGAGSDDIDKNEFVRFCMKRKALLFPAFQMQETLRTKIMGAAFWNEMSKRRGEITEHGKVDIMVVLNSITRADFDAMVGADPADGGAAAARAAKKELKEAAEAERAAKARAVKAKAASRKAALSKAGSVQRKLSKIKQSDQLRRQPSVVLEKGRYNFPAQPNEKKELERAERKAAREMKKLQKRRKGRSSRIGPATN